MTRVNDATQDLVAIIDDEGSVREALQDLLLSVGISSEGFGSEREFRAANLGDRVRCLVLDVRLPDQSGLETFEALTREGMRCPVIFLSGHADVRMTVRAMKAGAFDFFSKPTRDQDLLDAIQQALQHERTFRQSRQASRRLQERIASLSHRERQIMDLIVAGHRTKQIANEVGITEATVKFHRARIMQKIGLNSTAELVRATQFSGADPLNSTTSTKAG